MRRLPLFALAVIACCTLLISVDCKSSEPAGEPFVASGTADAPSKVNWRNWEPATFADAAKSDRPVFLFLTNVWCAPCDEMEESALNSEKVSAQLNQDFLPIRIDADRYPNIYDRYHLGGYPSCVILTPDARTIGGANYLSTDSLSLFLTQINRVWKENRPAVLAQADKLQNAFLQMVGRRKVQPMSDIALVLSETVVDRQFDTTFGGFGTQPKFPTPAACEYMFGATAPAGGLMFKDVITKTMNAQLALLDTVWGGFYRYASFADWSGASHEKLLDVNAQLLCNYLDIYQLAHDEKYRQAAEMVIKYIDRFLRGNDGWGFYASQQGVIKAEGKLVDPQEYFSQSDSYRQQQGIPNVDKSMYTEANCFAIRAYLKAYSELGRRDCGDYAIASLDQLLSRVLTDKGAVKHDPQRTDQTASGLLPDQIALVQTLLDAYEAVGKQEYVKRAQAVAGFITKNLVDHDSGGARYEVTAAGNPGRMAVSLKPFNHNAEAVIAFVRLYHITGDEEYRREAEGILRFLFNLPMREDDLRLCKLATAYIWYNRTPLTFVMVGPHGQAYDGLLQAARRTFYPRLVVLHYDPAADKSLSGKQAFPTADKPTLFVCLDTLRSTAIDDSATVIAKIKEFLHPK